MKRWKGLQPKAYSLLPIRGDGAKPGNLLVFRREGPVDQVALLAGLQAGLLGAETTSSAGVPDPRFRLAAKDVSVYAFTQDKAPRQLVDEKRAFIDERELGSIGDELSTELNHIASLLPAES